MGFCLRLTLRLSRTSQSAAPYLSAIGSSPAGNTITLTGYSGSTPKYRHYNGTYALPSAFAGIDGPMTYDTFYGTINVADQTIEITSEAKLQDMFQYVKIAMTSHGWQQSSNWCCWHRWRQRSRCFHPVTDAVYRLKYTQINEPANITGSGHVPLGGTLHSETILASCLAIAEQFFIPQSPHGYRAYTVAAWLPASNLTVGQCGQNRNNADPSEFAGLTGFTDARLSRYLHDNRVTVNGSSILMSGHSIAKQLRQSLDQYTDVNTGAITIGLFEALQTTLTSNWKRCHFFADRAYELEYAVARWAANESTNANLSAFPSCKRHPIVVRPPP